MLQFHTCMFSYVTILSRSNKNGMFVINNAVFILCSQLCFLERLMLPTYLAVLLVLKFLRDKLLILGRIVHSSLAHRTL